MNYNGMWQNQNPYLYQSGSTQPYAGAQAYGNDLVFTVSVNNAQQVENYPVAVGGTVILIDYEHGKLYSKTNPGNGFSPIVKTYTICEDNVPKGNDAQDKSISVEEFEELKKAVMELKNTLDDLTK